ncbi:SH3 domain-containing protein, partial [Anaerolineae bacterium CFX9]|nr:SH3 domain-containing protein [Anaerolineae bacterium CFX9]
MQNKQTILVLTLFFTLSLLTVTIVSAQAGGLDTTTASDASLRTGPSVDYRRLSILPAGTPFRADGRAPGSGWARGIVPSGEIGWVVYSALNASPEQLDALPSVWTDTPFTLEPPPGPVPTVPPSRPEGGAGQPTPAAPLPAPVVNTAPVRGFGLGGHVQGFGDYAAQQMRRAGMTWVKRQWRYQQGQSGDML